MSVEMMTWTFKHSPYKDATRLVHLAIADVANDEYENEIWLSFSKIASKANTSEKTVRRAVAQMVADGYLEHVEGAVQSRARYRFVQRDNLTHFPDEQNGTTATKNGTNEESALLLNSKNTSASFELETEDPTDALNTTERVVEDLFENAWGNYPRRVEKAGARKAFMATVRKGADPHVLVIAAHRYQAECQRENREPKFIKHGKTFFGPSEPWRDYTSEQDADVGEIIEEDGRLLTREEWEALHRFDIPTEAKQWA